MHDVPLVQIRHGVTDACSPRPRYQSLHAASEDGTHRLAPGPPPPTVDRTLGRDDETLAIFFVDMLCW